MFSINPRTPHARQSPERLYIPLCFLLIPLRTPATVPVQAPLHSTMFSINLLQHINQFVCGFPLHSTMFSINLFPRMARTNVRNSLHSTMFSINQILGRLQRPLSVSLHSTMFSINLGVHEDLTGKRYFTFHYVFY